MPTIGDYMVTRTGGFVAWTIRWLCHSPVNHAAVYIGGGKVVEAQPGGARVTDVAKYPDAIWSDMPLVHDDRVVIVWISLSLVGTPYSFWDIAALAVALITGRRTPRWIAHRLSRPDRLICSQLVDEAYRRAGVHLFDDAQRLPCEVTPGDLLNLIEEQRAAA